MGGSAHTLKPLGKTIMSIKKTTGAEIYQVRNNSEWATIVIRCWADPGPDGKPHHRGELLINSTHGTWSHYWGTAGKNFKAFLGGLDYSYLMGKLLGTNLTVYDPETTINSLKRKVLERRQRRALSNEQARWIYNEIEDRRERMERSAEAFSETCGEIQSYAASWTEKQLMASVHMELEDLLSEPWCRTQTRDNPHALGFWTELWPEVAEMLRSEAQAEVAAATAVADAGGAAEEQAGPAGAAHGISGTPLQFPTMLRKMWSGGQVQEWLDAHGAVATRSDARAGRDDDADTQEAERRAHPTPRA